LTWKYQLSEVSIRKDGQIKLYNHIYLENIFPIELSVYPRREIRIVSRSSTDGKAIVRLKIATLEKLLLQEHEVEWLEYCSDGNLKGFRN